ncbi:Glycosyl transferase family 2 [Propionibacterium ruminifibrarum]|uniref:Glycosyl transferase family 2 n=1 Tax=Propionibacterium ruminifibrarum TaxID=1962131 RepID=A0A375I6V8_9ACTN|nr:glycosyltransferase [Propionibacterium ruminifibrarum]SPF69153.1 Glycosyl transferase family 2 [Propionibacterium ruminifibrarum]
MTAFSVLLPVYAGDDPAFFTRALRSVSIDQSLKPDEIVIVRDGEVSDEIEAILDAAIDGSAVGGVPVTVVRIGHNRGLADALVEGLKACRYEIVARADADDISLPHRFATQIPVIVGDGGEPLDLLGAAIQEFETEAGPRGVVRVLPTTPEKITEMARFRDPFNHPTVVYRKAAVARAGGYRRLAKMEDYWLFVRMLQTGSRVANLAEPLVLYRVGAGAYQRRGGEEMLRSEIELQRAFMTSGFVTRRQGLRNIVVRGGYRLVPTWARKPAYRIMVRHGRGRVQTKGRPASC